MAVKRYSVINQGKPGKPGSTWFNSVGIPLNTLGVDGDFCLDISSGNVYKKSAGVWSNIGSIQGPSGPPGSGGGSDTVREVIVLTPTNIANKFITLTQVPSSGSEVEFFPDGGPKQRYGIDYTVIGSNIVSWASLGLDNFLEANDSIELIYTV